MLQCQMSTSEEVISYNFRTSGDQPRRDPISWRFDALHHDADEMESWVRARHRARNVTVWSCRAATLLCRVVEQPSRLYALARVCLRGHLTGLSLDLWMVHPPCTFPTRLAHLAPCTCMSARSM